MIDVASPMMLSATWDMAPWTASSDSNGCAPHETQAPSINVQNINLGSLWKSLSPRMQHKRLNKALKRPNPSFELMVQQPTRTGSAKRRKSTDRTHEVDPMPELLVDSHLSKSPVSRIEIVEPVAAPQSSTWASCDVRAALGSSTIATSDTLFTTLDSQKGQVYDSQELCDLCRQPFESDGPALQAHLAKHWQDLSIPSTCNKCQISFSHKGDLRWHEYSTEHKAGLHQGSSTDTSYHHISRLQFCFRLRKWEQAQLQHHARTIENLNSARSCSTALRSSSLPPRMRKPLAESVIDDRSTLQKDWAGRTACTGSASPDQADALSSLQQRIRDLTEQMEANSPSEQDTPYSEFCDSHSLPGSPVHVVSKVQISSEVRHTQSEPPLQLSDARECAVQTVPNHPSSRSDAATTARIATLPGQGQKRGSHGRDSDQWQNSENEGNEGLQPKKRKTANEMGTDAEKRIPCIYYVGDPVDNKNDYSRYRHISNLCRHLKSHGFYCCSTCIIRMHSSEEMDQHNGQHTKLCNKKGCKSTKPVGHCTDSIDCAHIMNAEDQWKALFVLQFNRQPPDGFIFGSRQQPNEDLAPPATNNENSQSSQAMMGASVDPFIDYSLTDSFFDEAMAFDPASSISNIESVIPVLANSELVYNGHSDNLICSSEAGLGAEGTTIAAAQTRYDWSDQRNPPIHDRVTSLQDQVSALERRLSTQLSKEKDQTLLLKEKVFQLEQKLYQSSEREGQLEATLAVIFEAFQATGAPQSQPGKALYNLVKSHSPQIVSSGADHIEPAQAKQRSSNSFLAMSPGLTFATSPGKVSTRTPPDSTYGSVR